VIGTYLEYVFFSEFSKLPTRFEYIDFVGVIDEAIRTVLGQSAPTYSIVSESFDVNNRIGSIDIGSRAHLHLLWAALTIYGCHFGVPLCIQQRSVSIITTFVSLF
jgi:hypothetical protein